MIRLTNQEAYEQIRSFFSKPDAKYGHAGIDGCVYRGPNNVRCAVGCIIPDELYDESFEILGGVLHLSGEKAEALLAYLPEDLGFLVEVQSLHDNLAWDKAPMDIFIEKLDKLAAKYGLAIVA